MAKGCAEGYLKLINGSEQDVEIVDA